MAYVVADTIGELQKLKAGVPTETILNLLKEQTKKAVANQQNYRQELERFQGLCKKALQTMEEGYKKVLEDPMTAAMDPYALSNIEGQLMTLAAMLKSAQKSGIDFMDANAGYRAGWDSMAIKTYKVPEEKISIFVGIRAKSIGENKVIKAIVDRIEEYHSRGQLIVAKAKAAANQGAKSNNELTQQVSDLVGKIESDYKAMAQTVAKETKDKVDRVVENAKKAKTDSKTLSIAQSFLKQIEAVQKNLRGTLKTMKQTRDTVGTLIKDKETSLLSKKKEFGEKLYLNAEKLLDEFNQSVEKAAKLLN